MLYPWGQKYVMQEWGRRQGERNRRVDDALNFDLTWLYLLWKAVMDPQPTALYALLLALAVEDALTSFHSKEKTRGIPLGRFPLHVYRDQGPWRWNWKNSGTAPKCQQAAATAILAAGSLADALEFSRKNQLTLAWLPRPPRSWSTGSGNRANGFLSW